MLLWSLVPLLLLSAAPIRVLVRLLTAMLLPSAAAKAAAPDSAEEPLLAPIPLLGALVPKTPEWPPPPTEPAADARNKAEAAAVTSTVGEKGERAGAMAAGEIALGARDEGDKEEGITTGRLRSR